MPGFSWLGLHVRQYGMWHDKLCLWIFGTTVFCSSKLTVFLELCFWKTVRISEPIMSAKKYLCIFWRQTCSISPGHFFTDLALTTTTGSRQIALDIAGSSKDILYLFLFKQFSSWNSARLYSFLRNSLLVQNSVSWRQRLGLAYPGYRLNSDPVAVSPWRTRRLWGGERIGQIRYGYILIDHHSHNSP